MNPTTTVVYKRASGCDIAADLYLPTVTSAGGGGGAAPPVVLWYHGGGMVAGGREREARFADSFTGAGFAFVSADYRLAPQVDMQAIVEDVLDALAWVRRDADRLGVDGTRVAVGGSSAGGCLALLVAARATDKPRAVVSFYGYGDVLGDWYELPSPYYNKQTRVDQRQARAGVGDRVVANGLPQAPERKLFYLHLRQSGRWLNEVIGAHPRDPVNAGAGAAMASDRFAPFRAIELMDGAYPPTMLLHGDRDHDVPYAQSVAVAHRLDQLGVPHRLLDFPGADHGFERSLSRQAWAAMFDDIIAFVAPFMQLAAREGAGDTTVR